LVALCERAAAGDAKARRLALELSEALTVLSTFDEGPDLVLHYKQLMVLEGNEEYRHHFNDFDRLSDRQHDFLHAQWKQFRQWWSQWEGAAEAS
jgi:4-hydroxy-tetrahydrodipicolinate synthase